MSEEQKKPKKKKMVDLFTQVSTWINHGRNSHAGFNSKAYPHKYLIVRPTRNSPTVLIELVGDPSRPVAQITNKDTITGQLVRALEELALLVKGMGSFRWENAVARRAVQHWIDTTDWVMDLPKSVGFLSTPGPVFFRLPFDPIETAAAKLPEKCPTWHEMLLRISNSEALIARIGSIFKGHADRKQAVYLSGPTNSGKSQLMSLIGYIAGADAPDGGGYATLGNDSLESQFWRATLIGKRVVCVGEATAKFLNTEAFKSITGDAWHIINEKGKPMYRAKLECLMFFFSNEPPALDSKPDLLERVIDCRVEPLDVAPDELMPDYEYQKLLKSELPHFLGHCLAQYSEGQIKCDKETLLESSAEKEAWALEVFDDYFRLDPGSWMRPIDVRSNLRMEGFTDNKIAQIYKIWERQLGIVKRQVRNENDRREWRVLGLTCLGGNKPN